MDHGGDAAREIFRAPAHEVRKQLGVDAGRRLALLGATSVGAATMQDAMLKIEPSSHLRARIAPGLVPVYTPMSNMRATCVVLGFFRAARKRAATSSRESQ